MPVPPTSPLAATAVCEMSDQIDVELEKLENIADQLEKNWPISCEDFEDRFRRVQRRLQELVRAKCGCAASYAENKCEGDSAVEQVQDVIIGRVYGLVGYALRGGDGRLRFSLNHEIVSTEQCRALQVLQGDVRDGKTLFTFWHDRRVVTPEFTPEDLHVIRDAVTMYSDGQLLMIEDVSALAGESQGEPK